MRRVHILYRQSHRRFNRHKLNAKWVVRTIDKFKSQPDVIRASFAKADINNQSVRSECT